MVNKVENNCAKMLFLSLFSLFLLIFWLKKGFILRGL
jgi:hypothetical protein